MNTPDWIQAIMDANGGGWLHPLTLSVEHPLVAEGWACLNCEGVFAAYDIGMVMPFHGGPDAGDDRWVAAHRECLVATFLPDREKRVAFRPPNYDQLTVEEQQVVDRRLHLIDERAIGQKK